MLLKRILSAIIGVPLVFVVVWLGGVWYAVAAVLAALGGLREFSRMSERTGHAISPVFAILASLAILVPTAVWRSLPAMASGLVLAVLLSLLFLLSLGPRIEDFLRWCIGLAGIVYVPLLLAHFILLRSIDHGARWIIFALLVTWATDTGAYVVGRTLGRHQLAPRISPKKTQEGAAGGLVWAIGVAVLLNWLLGTPGHLGQAIILGALVGTFAQVGDLAESMIKRQTGVKDSGRLIPGHGGLLDRLDSLLFTVPVVYYYAIWVLRPWM